MSNLETLRKGALDRLAQGDSQLEPVGKQRSRDDNNDTSTTSTSLKPAKSPGVASSDAARD